MKIVPKKRENAMGCKHPETKREAGFCWACNLSRLRKKFYPKPGEIETYTGGIDMKKIKRGSKVEAKKAAVKAAGKEGGSKTAKAARVTAGSVLVVQFGLKVVKGDKELIELVKKETGSEKFDDRQLAWYKSQYRAGKLKGQGGKPGKLEKVRGEGKGVVKAKVKGKVKKETKQIKEEEVEEPIEE